MPQSDDARAVRLEVFRSFSDEYASAPIRLMSRTAKEMRALGYADLATAIGDMDHRTVPADDPVDPSLREEWGALLSGALAAVPTWLAQLDVHPMGYNLASLGSPVLIGALSKMWRHQGGIELVNRPHETAQILVFHGGNQALQVGLQAVSERRRERGLDGPATILVPVPSFPCPLDQMALLGQRVWLSAPSDPGMDPGPDDVARIPDGVEIEGVYMMPINNPTGRTVDPERMAAYVRAVLDRWPDAAFVLDSVYVRLHPHNRELLAWYGTDPRHDDAIIIVDSLSKTHGVTGLRAGMLLTRSDGLGRAATRYAQNVLAGPSNLMQAMALALLAPYVTGHAELQGQLLRLEQRIGAHLARRRRLILERTFAEHGDLLASEQPVLPDPSGFDWEGSMYAVLALSEACCAKAAEIGVSPTVAFYLETGIAGVPLAGFCTNGNLARHGLLAAPGDDRMPAFLEDSHRFVRLSFGMTPPPRG